MSKGTGLARYRDIAASGLPTKDGKWLELAGGVDAHGACNIAPVPVLRQEPMYIRMLRPTTSVLGAAAFVLGGVLLGSGDVAGGAAGIAIGSTNIATSLMLRKQS
jgi:hypothetical protein